MQDFLDQHRQSLLLTKSAGDCSRSTILIVTKLDFRWLWTHCFVNCGTSTPTTNLFFFFFSLLLCCQNLNSVISYSWSFVRGKLQRLFNHVMKRVVCLYIIYIIFQLYCTSSLLICIHSQYSQYDHFFRII